MRLQYGFQLSWLVLWHFPRGDGRLCITFRLYKALLGSLWLCWVLSGSTRLHKALFRFSQALSGSGIRRLAQSLLLVQMSSVDIWGLWHVDLNFEVKTKRCCHKDLTKPELSWHANLPKADDIKGWNLPLKLHLKWLPCLLHEAFSQPQEILLQIVLKMF